MGFQSSHFLRYPIRRQLSLKIASTLTFSISPTAIMKFAAYFVVAFQAITVLAAPTPAANDLPAIVSKRGEDLGNLRIVARDSEDLDNLVIIAKRGEDLDNLRIVSGEEPDGNIIIRAGSEEKRFISPYQREIDAADSKAVLGN